MAEPSYIVENGRPISEDTEKRLLHKIAGSVYDASVNNKSLLEQIEYNTSHIILEAGSVTVNTEPLEALVAESNVILTDIASDTEAIKTSAASLDTKVAHCNTNDVEVTGSVLPDGAATEVTLAAVSTKLDTLSTINTNQATAAKQDTGNNTLSTINGKITVVDTDDVTITSSVLPAGAATAGRQDTANTTLGSIDTKITACNTGAVVVSSSVLPSGASTAARQDTTNTTLSSILSRTPPTIGYDAGGRTRVSQLTTLHDGKVTNGHSALLMATAGTGTFTVSTDSKTGMSVTSGQYCIYYSKKFLTYLAGKSKMVEETFDNFGPQSNVTKRVGYFSSNAVAPFDSNKDGFWLESGSGTITINMQRAGTAKIDALDILQWSGYDNLGAYQTPSNWNNFTVVIFDYLWLGGAMFRVWVKVGTQFILAHEYHHAGLYENTMIKDPNQTVRYEIRSSTGSGSFNYICSQVATEGSTDNSGCQRSVDSGTSAITCAVVGTTYPIKAIRKQSAYRQIPSSIEDFGIFINSTNDLVRYSIEINPTLSAPLTYGNVSNSSIQEATGNGTITVSSRGTVIASGYAYQRLVMPAGLLKENFLSYLGSTVADVMDEYVLCITPVTASVDCFGHITYKEY